MKLERIEITSSYLHYRSYGYLIKETEDMFYYCSELTYHWLKKANCLNWISDMEIESRSKKSFSYFPYHTSPLSYQFPEKLGEFSLSEIDKVHFPQVSSFFDWFMQLKHLSIQERYRYAFEKHENHIPHFVFIKINKFLYDHFVEDENRLRLLFAKGFKLS